MSYKILSRDLIEGTMVVLYDTGEKYNIRTPLLKEGTPEFDAAVEKVITDPTMPDWYNKPGDTNVFKKTMPIYDRRTTTTPVLGEEIR